MLPRCQRAGAVVAMKVPAAARRPRLVRPTQAPPPQLALHPHTAKPSLKTSCKSHRLTQSGRAVDVADVAAAAAAAAVVLVQQQRARRR